MFIDYTLIYNKKPLFDFHLSFRLGHVMDDEKSCLPVMDDFTLFKY